MAITTVDDIAAMVAASPPTSIFKSMGAAKAAGSFVSGWTAAGRPGAGSAAPAYTAGSGYTCSRTTAGALGQANGATQNWLARVAAGMSVAGTLLIYDRLWSCSGMGFAASTYTVTTPGSLPARITDNGVGVKAFVENFVAAGAASGTLTMNYVNTVPTGGRSGVISAVVSAPLAGQLQPIPLQVGDLGISQLTSIVTSATWTSGSFGITLMKLIAAVPCPVAGVWNTLDWAAVLEKIPADACVQFALHASTTTAASVFANMTIGDK